jgi:hypothetical protein
MEIANIDLRVEFKRNKRQISLKFTNLSAPLLIRLFQDKTTRQFNVEFYLDPNSDIALTLKKDQVGST